MKKYSVTVTDETTGKRILYTLIDSATDTAWINTMQAMPEFDPPKYRAFTLLINSSGVEEAHAVKPENAE